MDKWSQKWIRKHPDASLQEFAIALSQRMTRTSITLIGIEIAAFIVILLLTSVL